MGELLFTIGYGGALIIMGFLINQVLKNTLITHAYQDTDPEKEEAL